MYITSIQKSVIILCRSCTVSDWAGLILISITWHLTLSVARNVMAIWMILQIFWARYISWFSHVRNQNAYCISASTFLCCFECGTRRQKEDLMPINGPTNLSKLFYSFWKARRVARSIWSVFLYMLVVYATLISAWL
jgi:hypothetical protein